MMMTVEELIEQLQEFNPDTEVKLGLQPNYPMKGSIKNICLERDSDDNEKCVWIACSGNEDYSCPSLIWDEAEIGPTKE